MLSQKGLLRVTIIVSLGIRLFNRLFKIRLNSSNYNQIV